MRLRPGDALCLIFGVMICLSKFSCIFHNYNTCMVIDSIRGE